MPYVVTRIDIQEVQQALRDRGWNFEANRNFGIRLTKNDTSPEGRFKSTGRAKQIPMIGVSERHLEQILHHSQDLQEAVEQIEKLSIGEIMAPSFGGRPIVETSPEVQERLIRQRIENEVGKVADQAKAMLAQQQAKIDDLEARLSKTEQRKKPGPKPGTKRRKIVELAEQEIAGEE